MKRALILASLIASVGVMAQGTLLLTNGGGGANSPVYEPDGTTKVAKNVYTVAVYVGGSEAAATGATSPVKAPFALDKAGGLFNAGQVELAGFAPGSKPWIKVEVWETAKGGTLSAAQQAGGKWGVVVFQLGAGLGGDPGTGEPPYTTPGLVGMPKLTLVPEPSVMALVGLGVAAFLLRRRN
ncbi:MAG: PEP-CTERM sorting domain-containing protein [Verrucomicrobiae bacterium]|nr:PEP-CTERM sorting domain-containing protein [Verrucomicrobiae bacterium]